MKKINTFYTPESLPIEFTRYAEPNTICHGKIVGDCLKGDLTSDKEVLVLGDSHAAMLNHFFDYLGKELNFKAQVITASSCVTIPKFDYKRLPSWGQRDCTDQIAEAKREIVKADVVFLAACWSCHFKSDEFIVAINNFLDTTKKNNVKVFIMPQEPLLNKSPLRNYRFKQLNLEMTVSKDSKYLLANDRLKDIAENFLNVHVVKNDTGEFFNNAPFYENELTYFDKHHLNEVGSKLYAGEIIKNKELIEILKDMND